MHVLKTQKGDIKKLVSLEEDLDQDLINFHKQKNPNHKIEKISIEDWETHTQRERYKKACLDAASSTQFQRNYKQEGIQQ